MNPTIDLVRGELERLFTLEEMTKMSERLLGLAPKDVGGLGAKGSFALALTERCFDGDRIDALVDVILHAGREVDPRVRDVAALIGRNNELQAGSQLGDFTIERRIADSDLGIVYQAVRQDGGAKAVYTLKVLRHEVARDRRAVHRFLTANRLVGTVDHPGIPRHLEAGEIEPGVFYVAHQHLEAQPLAARLARTGPAALADLKPILRGILEPLAALHKAQLVHGDLRTENIMLAARAGDAAPAVWLVDFGVDRLRPANGHNDLLAVFGSPKTVAPEIVRGKPADARSDVYAFGAVLYELLTGKPVFQHESAAEAAFAHLSVEAPPPSERAPHGWVGYDVDAFVLGMLEKDPMRRPRDASALLESIDNVGRASPSARAGGIAPAAVQELVDRLLAAPHDLELALSLEHAVDQGADPIRVGEAFSGASARVRGSSKQDTETKKALLFRAARIFDGAGRDKPRAEQMFAAIGFIDPQDEIALTALEDIRKAQGKYEEVVEMLLARSQAAPPGPARGHALAEIGRLYDSELHDPEQALVAYAQALCEDPRSDEYAGEVERLCGARHAAWTEHLTTIDDALKESTLSQADQLKLTGRAGRWYETKLGRADMALAAYQHVLANDPTDEAAAEGMTNIYRRAEQWPELCNVLIARADVATSAPKARDHRAEAAEVLETRLNETTRARGILMTVLADDPGHARACEGMARIAERTGDFVTLAQILERRAGARQGLEKAEAMAKVAEVYEDHLSDLPEATRRYEAVLAIDPSNLGALKGLDRIFNRTGRYRELLEVLKRQLDASATPRQKINLYERIAGLYDEEFVDHGAAVEALETILSMDAAHDGALTSLARHYRALGKWEPAVAIYEKHAASTNDSARKVDLLLARARTLAEQIGSPDRATKAYEHILQLFPGHPHALEALAQLRESSGDSHAALSALEALAMKAPSPEARSEQWMRAARLLESHGDKDGAIERYKLALDANPRDPSSASALRKAYAERNNWLGVVGLVERELHTAESDLARARLFAELAKVFHSQLVDPQKADAAARSSLGLDPSNPDALMVLGDIAYEGGHMADAAMLYESLVSRASVLAKEDAVRVLVRYLEAFGKAQPKAPSAAGQPISQQGLVSEPWIGGGAASQGRVAVAGSGPDSVPPPSVTNPRILAAIDALRTVAPQDVDALARAANALFEFGDPKSAYRMSQELFTKYGAQLAGSERAEALYNLGESARRSDALAEAMPPLREAIDLDPSNPKPYRALAKVYDERGDWFSGLDVRRARLQLAPGPERFELLLEIGDVLFGKLNDRAGASRAYSQALEERPDDRKLLTKLMQLYSEEQDWQRVCEVVLRLADGVEDRKQRAKYMHTAATIASKHLDDVDMSLDFYRRALDFDPALEKALDEALDLYRQRGRHDEVENLLKTQLDQAKIAQDRGRIVRILDRLGEVYHLHLNDADLAVDAYEAAQAFDPDDRARAEKLAELYAADPAQYLDKAVAIQAGILRKNAYRVESYKVLRQLYTNAKKADPAWCLCQALSILRIAEPDEERFYRKHKSENAAPAQSTLDDAGWQMLMHWELDPLLTRLFATIQPTIIRVRTQPIADLGYDARYAIDTALHPYPVSQTLFYAHGVLSMAPPLVFQNQNEPGALGIVHAHTPAIILGQAAFDHSIPNQSLAFVAGRHLTSFRPGFYVRHLVPTGTGLKAWLFAAIKLCVPQFPVAAELGVQVKEATIAMEQDFSGGDKDKLASIVTKLLHAGGALDLKKWVGAIDLTADRVGLLLAHDLQIATEVVRSTEEASSVAVKERMKDIVLFSVSEEYFALRQKLGVAIDA